jgi:hypothetical protein
MQIRSFTLVFGVILIFGLAGSSFAQENGDRQRSARQQLQRIHTPQSIDQELTRLTKDLELTPEQQQKVRPLFQQHHDKTQALLDQMPSASRQELGPQIHAISDETHRQIHVLLTDHQKELEKTMQHREHNGEENWRPAPVATEPPDPSLTISRCFWNLPEPCKFQARWFRFGPGESSGLHGGNCATSPHNVCSTRFGPREQDRQQHGYGHDA